VFRPCQAFCLSLLQGTRPGALSRALAVLVVVAVHRAIAWLDERNTMLRGFVGVFAVAVLALTPAVATAKPSPAGHGRKSAPIRQLVSFGDSWSSANEVFGTRPGGSWPQLLAAKFGDVQTADTAGGLNFARGGAFVAPISPYSDSGTLPTPVTAQIDAYLAGHERFRRRQLVTIWAGGNDIFAYLGGWSAGAAHDQFCTGTQTQAQLNTIATQVASIAERQVDVVRQVLDHGGKHVVLLDMVDMSLTANDPCVNAAANAIIGVFTKHLNLATRAELAASGLANDRRVAFVPISELFNDIAARPADHGFEVVDGNACSTSDFACGPDAWVTPDADRTYVFAGWATSRRTRAS
jgi:outer membrane lipase/esterase